MRIAILGAGFAGLSVTWFLLHYTQGNALIDLYDPQPIGKGASGISSGMLHPYAGKHAKLSWESAKGMKETHRLITEASRAIHQSVIHSKGILRPALTEEQFTDFQTTAKQYPDVEWWERDKCLQTHSGLLIPEGSGALFIKNGLTLNIAKYLDGLWQACALLGAQHIQRPITTKEQLEPYDLVLVAVGATCKYFLSLKTLPISIVKGQILELRWPHGVSPLPFSINSEKYLIMHPDANKCVVGSTFEHDFKDASPHMEKAKVDILPKIISFFPDMQKAAVLNCYAGFRATTPTRLPVAGQIDDKTYFFTGLGSKGLLYHAWIGKTVARAMLTGTLDPLPEKIRFKI